MLKCPEARAKMTEFGTAGKDELMAGYTMTSKEGLRIGGTLILSGNADTSDVLSGKEFYTTDPKTKKGHACPVRQRHRC